MTFIGACHHTRKEYNEEPINASNEAYETSEFTYLQENRSKRVKLCDVRYYVNGDTIFTSEKYHALFLSYSNDITDNLSYRVAVYFDTSQQANDYGWYYLTLQNKGIPRVPGTILSSIVLRNYIGPLIEEKSGVYWANTVLYNIRKDMFVGQDKNIISPEIHKLLPYFK